MQRRLWSVGSDHHITRFDDHVDLFAFSQVETLSRFFGDDRDDLKPIGEFDNHLSVNCARQDPFDRTLQCISRADVHCLCPPSVIVSLKEPNVYPLYCHAQRRFLSRDLKYYKAVKKISGEIVSNRICALEFCCTNPKATV